MSDEEIIASLKREPAAELRRLQRQPYEWKVRITNGQMNLFSEDKQ